MKGNSRNIIKTGLSNSRMILLLLFTMILGGVNVVARNSQAPTPTGTALTAEMLKNGYTISVDGDYYLAPGDASPLNGWIIVSKNITATLDLNGATLTNAPKSSSTDGSLIRNYGNLTINDSSADKTGTIDGNYLYVNNWAGRGIRNETNATLIINDANIRNCVVAANSERGGAAIVNMGSNNVTINNVNIYDCKANCYAGAIDNINSTLTINKCNIKNCQAVYGGAIRNTGTLTIMNNVVIQDCIALNGEGGAVYNYGPGTFNMEGGLIEGCIAKNGGGVYNIYTKSNFNMSGGKITQCYAVNGTDKTYYYPYTGQVGDYCGGGVYNTSNGTINFTGGTITRNYAASGSGGIHNYNIGAKLNINGEKAVISYNTAYQFGGSTHCGGGAKMYFTEGEICYNTALKGDDNSSGGGISIGYANGSELILGEKAKIYGNRAEEGYGGGIFMRDSNGSGGTITLQDGEVYGNYAKLDGGGIYAQCAVKIDGIHIYDNTTDSSGGGIYFNSNCSVFIFNSGVIEGNYAAIDGGGIYLNKIPSKITFKNGIVRNNTAMNNGGGAFSYFSSISYGTDGGNMVFEGNTATNGGGLYVENGTTAKTMDIIGGEVVHNTSNSYGGGIYVTGKVTFNISGNTHIAENVASASGGGLYLDGITAKYSAGTLRGNIAHENGGGIYLSKGTTLSYSGGLITYNKADGTCSNTTAYLNPVGIKGVGGGVFVDEGTFTLSGENVGIYGNTASIAADDIYNSGKKNAKGISVASISVPSVDGMDISEYEAKATGWYEDYVNNDTEYANGLKGDENIGGVRYRGATENPVEWKPSKVPFTTNLYACLTVGLHRSGIVISKSGLKKGESAAFSVYEESNPSKVVYVLLTGIDDSGTEVSQMVTLALYTSKYVTVAEQPWSWAYEPKGNTILKQDITVEGGNIFTFTNESNDKVPLHDEAIKVNSMGASTK